MTLFTLAMWMSLRRAGVSDIFLAAAWANAADRRNDAGSRSPACASGDFSLQAALTGSGRRVRSERLRARVPRCGITNVPAMPARRADCDGRPATIAAGLKDRERGLRDRLICVELSRSRSWPLTVPELAGTVRFSS
jgi:hypothetical protein